MQLLTIMYDSDSIMLGGEIFFQSVGRVASLKYDEQYIGILD